MHLIKKIAIAALGLASLSACLATSPPGPSSASQSAPAADLSGVWVGALTDPQGGRHPITLNLKVDGSAVTGTLIGGPPDGAEAPLVDGKLEGDHLSFNTKTNGPQGGLFVLNFKGKVSGNRIQGMHGAMGDNFPWEATRK